MAQSENDLADPVLLAFIKHLLAERNYSSHTADSYRMDICEFARMVLDLDLNETPADWRTVSLQDARAFIVKLHENEISKTSTIRKLSAMRSFYRYMEREAILNNNPFAGLKSPKKKKALPLYMTVKEVGQLLDAPDAYWNAAAANGIAKDADSA